MPRKHTLKSWLCAVMLALLPLAAHSVGLGKLTVTSPLGHPLRAEIELLALQEGEAANLAARLASPEAFREAQIERFPLLSAISFSIEQKSDGKHYLKLSSALPVNEPVLDILIELNWPAGRLLREYTLLLDPPGFAGPQAGLAVAAPAAPSEAAEEPQGAPKPPAVAKGEPPPASKKQPKRAKMPAETYGPVKNGETLREIAAKVKPEGYSLEQMLLGLYQSNRPAFADSNMNRLRTGPILRIPEPQQLSSISHAEAVKEIRVHAANWNAYRQKLAATVAASPGRAAEPGQAASGKIAAAVSDKAPPPADSRDVLRLSKGEEPKQASGDSQALQGRIQALEEEKTVKEKTAREANQRIADLEKTVKDMQRLLEIRNQQLAALQKELAPAQPAAPAKQAAQPSPPPAPAATGQQPKPTLQPKPPLPGQPEPSLLEEVLGNPLALRGGAAALLLAASLAAALWWRRIKPAKPEESIARQSDLKARTVFGGAAGGVVDTGSTTFLTDFGAGLASIDTHEVDPIAEAEVYLAYGRDAQAEEILKEALAKDAGRHELRLKLLQIYSSRKNVAAFEPVAEELHAALGDESNPLWLKAAEMGRRLNPANPLFAQPQPATPAAAEAGQVAAEPSGEGPQPPAAETVPPAPDDQDAAPARAEENLLEFDLDALRLDLAAPSEKDRATEEEAAGKEQDAGLEFDLDAIPAHPPGPAEPSAAAPEEAPAMPMLDLSGISLELNDSAGEPPPAEPTEENLAWQEAATKLDLAKAYLDMGDKEGAREILEEVIQEGNAEQQESARKFLAAL